MSREKRATWNEAERASLLAEYFGEKLASPALEQLIAQTTAALEEHGRLRRGTPLAPERDQKSEAGVGSRP